MTSLSATRPRHRGLVALAVLGAAGLPLAVWLGGALGELGREPAAAPAAVVRQVGADRTAELPGLGPVTLRVEAEVAADAPTGDAVPAGAPVTLAFALPPSADATTAALTALREPPPAASGTAVPPADVPLERNETFLLNRADGALTLPSYGTAAAGHQHGATLTQGMPAGGFAWATTTAARPIATATDPAGRWLAVAPPEGDWIELVDLARRQAAHPVAVGGPATGLWFDAAGSRLWVGTPAGLVGVDPLAGAAGPPVPTGAPADVAFDAAGERALVVERAAGRVHLVDPAAGTVVATAEVPGEPVAAAFAPAASPAGSFVVASRAGELTLLPRTAEGGLGPLATVPLGAPGADLATVEVGPDGRTAIVPDRASATVAVVDTGTGRVAETVDATAGPSEVVFLENFAVVRNTGSTDATWIDLSDPSKSDNVTLGSAPPGALAVTADGAEVLAPVPADARVFRLHVMMGRPMVMASDDNPTGADAVVAVSSTLHRAAPGVLVQRTVLADPGVHRLRLTVGDAAATFPVEVAAPSAPEMLAYPAQPTLTAAAGQPVTVRFTTGRELSAPEVLAYADTPAGPRQIRVPAEADGDGYVATFTPAEPGRYLVYLLDAEAGLTTGTGRPATVDVT